MAADKQTNRRILSGTGAGALLIGLYLASLYNYLLFHSLVELFSIVIGFTLFVLAWNLRKYIENNYLVFIGVAYFFISSLDLLHTLSYKGMAIFTDYDYYANQVWIAARYLESLSLLAAFALLVSNRRFRPYLVFISLLVVTVLLTMSIFVWKVFPVCFVEGAGLTPFKKLSEYIISFILVVDLWLLYRYRRRFEEQVLRLMIGSISLTIVSELAFTFYISNYGFSNLVGHYAKLVSFWLIYKAIIETGMVRPFDLIFRELAQKENNLALAKREAEQASQAKSVFLTTMSHEIRTPLNVILNMTDLALTADDWEEAREYITDLGTASRHLLSLINEILDFSKIEAGRLELEEADFDLYGALRSILKPLEYRAREKGLEFTMDIHPDTPGFVKGDPARMRQVLINLVDNAIKFTESGSVAVYVQPYGGPEGDERPLAFIVEDTGIGIDPEVRETIFESFRQADSSITRKYGGTGLGLSICRHLTEMMGGGLAAEARTGGGAVFTARMLFRRGDPDRASRCSGEPVRVFGRASECRILVVEDNPLNYKVSEALLKKIGCTSRNAANGSEAIDSLSVGGFDLVLMDFEMPVMDGLEAARLIRAGAAGEENRDLPIIAMTAHAIAGFKDECLQAGMNDYLAKPVDIHALSTVLARYLPSDSPGEDQDRTIGIPGDEKNAAAGSPVQRDDRLKMEKALSRMAGDRELLQNLQESFAEELPERIEAIDHAVLADDLDEIARIGHSLKGSCGLIGADSCENLCRKMEEAAVRNSPDQAKILAARLQKELDLVGREIVELYRT